MPTRRTLKTGLSRIALAGPFRGLCDYWIAPSLRMRAVRWRIVREDWTAPPLRIAAVSDLHMSWPGTGRRRLSQVVTRVNAIGADLVVLLGDFAPAIWGAPTPEPFADTARTLARLQARHGVYAVLGNHDWDHDVEARRRGGPPNVFGTALGDAGIRVLSNAAVRVGGIWLAGLEDQRVFSSGPPLWRRHTGLDDLEATLSQIGRDGPVILLAHEPDIFAEVPDRVSLTLSGHTHGGQIRVFGRTPVVPSRFGSRYVYGHVREGRRDLVVSGGIGCSGLPLRLGVIPEITVIEVMGPG